MQNTTPTLALLILAMILPLKKRPHDSAKDATKKQKKDNGWAPKEQRDQRCARGACLDCGREGHKAQQCKTGNRATTPISCFQGKDMGKDKGTSNTRSKDKKKHKDTGSIKVAELGETTTRITELDSDSDSSSGKD